MNRVITLAAMCFALVACQKRPAIDWSGIDYGIERAADSHKEETHK